MFLRPDGQFTGAQVEVAWLNQKLVSGPASRLLDAWRFGLARALTSARFAADQSACDVQLGVPHARSPRPLPAGRHHRRRTAQGRSVTEAHKDGHVDVVRANMASPGPDVAAVRQRLVLLVDQGRITSDVASTSWVRLLATSPIRLSTALCAVRPWAWV
jgi:hypothetical protein